MPLLHSRGVASVLVASAAVVAAAAISYNLYIGQQHHHAAKRKTRRAHTIMSELKAIFRGPQQSRPLSGNAEKEPGSRHNAVEISRVRPDQKEQNEEIIEEDIMLRPVVSKLKQEAMREAVVKNRIYQLQTAKATSLTFDEMYAVKPFKYPYQAGAYNLAYAFEFEDQTQWYVRVPGHGFRFGYMDIEKMESEYRTMKYIRNNTTIEMPEVIYWNTASNEIGAPFGIISGATGHQVVLKWDGMDEESRSILLFNIASQMSQFGDLPFRALGSLSFDENSTETYGIGPYFIIGDGDPEKCALRRTDYFSWSHTTDSGPNFSTREFFEESIDNALVATKKADCYADVNDLTILRIALDTMPTELLDEEQFYLKKPDLNWQNIFINDDLVVTSFIDWDGVATSPSINGYAQLPVWLWTDWLPHFDEYEADKEKRDPEDISMSPEEHRRYRHYYTEHFTELMEGSDNYDPRMTSLSHVVGAIEHAIQYKTFRKGVTDKVMKEAEVGFTVDDYIIDAKKGDTSTKDAQLRLAFTQAWLSGWDTKKSIGHVVKIEIGEEGSQEDSENEEGGPKEDEVENATPDDADNNAEREADNGPADDQDCGDITDDTDADAKIRAKSTTRPMISRMLLSPRKPQCVKRMRIPHALQRPSYRL